MMWNPCCDCETCPCEGCDFEECDCESCEETCRDDDQSKVKKRRISVGDPSKLYDAITRKDKSKICQIIRKENVNLRTIYANGNRALHLVVQKFEEEDLIQILKAFISKKVNLYFKNKDRETILHMAVEKRMKKTIDFLLKKDFKIEMMYKQSNPVPHFVIENEYEKFLKLQKKGEGRERVEIESANYVEWLISKGFDFDRVTRCNQSALHLAIERNLQHLLPTLLKHSTDIKYINENTGRTLLHSFIAVNDQCKEEALWCRGGIYSVGYAERYTRKIINTLLDRGVSVDAVDKYGNTVLHTAIRTNVKMGIFEILLDRFTNVHHKDRSEKTLLHDLDKASSWAESEAEADCYLRIMRSLIAKGADVNARCKDGSTPLYQIAEDKNLRAFELMKESNADFSVTPFGSSLLHLLAKKKPSDKSTDETQVSIFELLIGEGCDVNAVNKYGQLPLHLAVRDRNTVMIRKLVAHGSNVNSREKKRQMTPLHYAVEYKEDIDVAELLLDNGANVNSKSFRGMRVLHWAAGNSSSHMVKMLLKRGAYVHAQDNERETALSKALLHKSPAVVEELLKYGADINDSVVLRRVENFYEENYNGVVDPVLQQWIKLEAANLPCAKEYKAIVEKTKYHQTFYQGCLKEIELLKSTFIDDRTTFYKFLQINPNRRCAYAYCETLQKYIDSSLLEKQFPKYSVLILGNYHAAMARNSLIGKAKQAWLELTKITLPDVCIERIFTFLNNANLIDMVEEY